MYITPFKEVNVAKDPNIFSHAAIYKYNELQLMQYYLYTMFTIKLCLPNKYKINAISQCSVYCIVNADIIRV